LTYFHFIFFQAYAISCRLRHAAIFIILFRWAIIDIFDFSLITISPFH
jgi:hypothetical protein